MILNEEGEILVLLSDLGFCFVSWDEWKKLFSNKNVVYRKTHS